MIDGSEKICGVWVWYVYYVLTRVWRRGILVAAKLVDDKRRIIFNVGFIKGELHSINAKSSLKTICFRGCKILLGVQPHAHNWLPT